jgi:hypothetical protein
MTVGAILSRTSNFFFRKLNFDYPYWSTYEHANWDDLDAALASIGASSGIVGAWTNSLAVEAGQRYVDTTTGTPYLCLVSHTTVISPTTFATERTNNPSYWVLDAVANNSITFAKLQDIATKTFIGRITTGSGDPESITMPNARLYLGVLPPGQCRLSYVSTSAIKLSPFGGNLLMIADAPCLVPSAGVSLAPTGLTPNTDYYIFAADANGDEIVDTLYAELTSVGLDTDATTGVRIKLGDRTRTLVGIARPIAGPTWENARPYVRSYFNRQPTFSSTVQTANRTYTNTGAGVEVHTSLRAEFIAFTDDRLVGTVSYPVVNSGANETYLIGGVDGTLPTSPAYGVMVGTTLQLVEKVLPFTIAADGYHYLTPLGSVVAGTGTLGKSASGLFGRTTVAVG